MLTFSQAGDIGQRVQGRSSDCGGGRQQALEGLPHLLFAQPTAQLRYERSHRPSAVPKPPTLFRRAVGTQLSERDSNVNISESGGKNAMEKMLLQEYNEKIGVHVINFTRGLI